MTAKSLTSRTRPGQWSWAIIIAGALLFTAVPTVAQTGNNATIQEVINQFNGNWRLVQRTNPDGTVHRQPLQGTTVIDLSPAPTAFGLLGPRALGTIFAQESGVLDERCDNCGPAEARGRPFKIESSGTWAVSVESQSADHYIVSVSAVTRIKGNYAPYLEGLNANVLSRYRVAKKGQTLSGESGIEKRGQRDRAAAEAGANVQILNEVTFANLAAPPITDAGDLIPPYETADSCCSVDDLFIVGDIMTILYTHGASDTWSRAPATGTGSAAKAPKAGKR
ncbi:MAG: hypothetical protein AAF604_10430 [Acidobacteriota bacterium]